MEKFLKEIPKHLLKKSGSVFYSGRDAFSGSKDLYLLGLNPGGCPELQKSETVGLHTQTVIDSKPNDWSEYRDESWNSMSKGSCGMQPRVLYLLSELGLSAGQTPASNVVFLRSRRESTIAENMNHLINECWGFHEKVLEELTPKAILCFGGKAGEFVCKKLGAKKQIDEFIEANNRNWHSRAYKNDSGVKVLVLTHPSIADWTAPKTDPSEMVKRVINC